MGDAWDDDDFELDVNIPTPAAEQDAAPVNWDDDEALADDPVVSHGSAPKLSAAKAQKVKAQKDAAKKAAVEEALGDLESEGERRLRERQDVEDADHELAKDLYGSSQQAVAQGLEFYQLRNLKEYLTLAQDVSEKFEEVKGKQKKANQFKFFKELLTQLEKNFSIDECDELATILSSARVRKEQEKKKNVKAPAAKKATKTKKQMQAETDKHADLFGGFVEDEYQDFEDEYDDFM